MRPTVLNSGEEQEAIKLDLVEAEAGEAGEASSPTLVGNRILGPLTDTRPCESCGHHAIWKVAAGLWLKASCQGCLIKYGLSAPGGSP